MPSCFDSRNRPRAAVAAASRPAAQDQQDRSKDRGQPQQALADAARRRGASLTR
jgi:hypothetical protein